MVDEFYLVEVQGIAAQVQKQCQSWIFMLAILFYFHIQDGTVCEYG